jgi:hypothetical protein
MSPTTRTRPSIEPGVTDVIPSRMIEHVDPGGVICTTRKSSPAGKSASSRHASPVP